MLFFVFQQVLAKRLSIPTITTSVLTDIDNQIREVFDRLVKTVEHLYDTVSHGINSNIADRIA